MKLGTRRKNKELSEIFNHIFLQASFFVLSKEQNKNRNASLQESWSKLLQQLKRDLMNMKLSIF
jgi:hypothetical protein